MHSVKQKLWQSCTFLSSQAEFSFLPGYVRRIHAQKVKKEEGWACDFFMSLFFGSGQVEKCPPPDLLSLFLGTLPPSKVFGRGGGRVKSAQETETQEERRRGEGDKCAIVTGNFSFLLVLSSARLTLFLSSNPPLGGKYTISPFLLLKEGQGGPAVHLLCPFLLESLRPR